MKKKILIIIAAFMAVTVFLTGCKSEEENILKEELETKALAYETDISESLESITDQQGLKNYIVNRAKSKNISYTVDKYDNIILNIPASDEYRNTPPSVVLCDYDVNNVQPLVAPITSAFCLAKNNNQYGELNVIFVNNLNKEFKGIKGLDSKYFPDNANVFYLNDGDKPMFSFTSAYLNNYHFSSPVEYTEPIQNTAYKISITGLEGGTPDSKISNYPNPIKEFGDILAGFKTGATVFELADFHGGYSPGMYPKEASMTIVIDESNIQKFEKKMNKSIKKFTGKYGKRQKNLEYTCEQIDLPNQVLTNESQNTFVSSIYTLEDGIFERNNSDETIALTNIGQVKLGWQEFIIDASGTSLTENTLAEIDNNLQNICGISGINFEKTTSFPNWQASEDSEFANDIKAAYKKYYGDSLHFQNCLECTGASYIAEKNKNCNLVNVIVDRNKIERYSGTILTYMMDLSHVKEQADAE